MSDGPSDIPMTRLIGYANAEPGDNLTPAQSINCRAFVHCPRCRAFKDLDLLAYLVAGLSETPWARLYERMRCKACGTPPNFLWVGIDEAERSIKKFACGTN